MIRVSKDPVKTVKKEEPLTDIIIDGVREIPKSKLNGHNLKRIKSFKKQRQSYKMSNQQSVFKNDISNLLKHLAISENKLNTDLLCEIMTIANSFFIYGSSEERKQNIDECVKEMMLPYFLDDDDVYLPHKIEYNLIDSRIENCSAILCGYQILESGEHSNFLQSQIIKKEVFKLGNPFCGTSGLFAKREFLLKEMFDESLPLGEDWDVFIRLTKYGVMYFNSVPHFLYRKGHESITTSAKKQSVNDVERYILSSRKHREWLGESNYKVRVARVYLSYIRFKNNKLSWVYHSIKAAGFKANFIVFFNIFMKIR